MITETESLAIGPSPAPSKAAQLLALLPSIEAAVRAGHSHVSIHEYLVNSKGLDLTFRYYELTLCRLRKRVKQAASQLTPNPPPVKRNEQGTALASEVSGTAPLITGATSKIQDVLFGSAADFFS